MVTNTCPCIPEIGHWQRSKSAAGEVNGLAYIATTLKSFSAAFLLQFWGKHSLRFAKGRKDKGNTIR